MARMAQPTPYDPATDFSGEELANAGGRSTVDTAALDAELAAVGLTTDQILVNLALNQRDDGEIRDGRVKLHTLATAVLALFAATAGTPRGAWGTATAYALRDVVTQNTNTYLCCVAHTSGVFATDLAAVKWLLITLGTAPAASTIPFVATATIASTNVQAAIEEADTEGRALTAAVSATLTALSNTVTAYIAAIAASTGATLMGYIHRAATAVARTVSSRLQENVSVLDFMSLAQMTAYIGNTATLDLTTPINNAIAWARTQTYGATIELPVGTLPVTEINATSAAADFTRTVRLRGQGRFMSRIVPFAAGGVLLNLMGTNDFQVEDLHFDSTPYTSQCAIFLARSTTSINCNNNKFRGVWITGSYTVASVVSNGSESSTWFGGRIENINVAASYRCFWSGGGTGIKALQNITTVNGGTVLDVGNPNTDNKMFGVEFYAPYASAYPVRFSQASSYQFFGCTIICGSSNNCRLVSYGDPSGGRFNGPISWHGCHMEVLGTGNVVHYLDATGATQFDGINSLGGYYVLSNNTAVLDFDRTAIANQPQLSSSTWTTPTTAPNSTGTNAYVYLLASSSFTFRPNTADGNLFVSGFINNSKVDVTSYLGPATRGVGCYTETVAAAVPTTGTFSVGHLVTRETPVVGQPVGWKCTVSGTLGVLNAGATTGSITTGTNVLVVNTVTGLGEGQRIAIAGVASGPFYIRKLVGTTAYLDANANATVAGAAVSFSNATLVALANL